MMQCIDLDRVLFVGFMLEDQAKLLREEYERCDEISWAEFKTEMMLTVMPIVIHQRMSDKFYEFQ